MALLWSAEEKVIYDGDEFREPSLAGKRRAPDHRVTPMFPSGVVAAAADPERSG